MGRGAESVESAQLTDKRVRFRVGVGVGVWQTQTQTQTNLQAGVYASA